MTLRSTVASKLKDVPVLGRIIAHVAARTAFPKVQLQGVLEGYEAYVYRPEYRDPQEFQEPFAIEFLKDNLAHGETFLDIGAHFGYFSLLAHKRVGPTGTVVAFEPSPVAYRYLKKNQRLTGAKNFITEQALVADERKEVDFKYSLFGGSMSTTREIDHPLFKQTRLSCVTVDSYIKTHNLKPQFIKIDVEGAELSVLQGMSNLLAQKPTLFIEVHHQYISGQEHEQIRNNLLEQEYHIYALEQGTSDPYELVAYQKGALPARLVASATNLTE